MGDVLQFETPEQKAGRLMSAKRVSMMVAVDLAEEEIEALHFSKEVDRALEVLEDRSAYA